MMNVVGSDSEKAVLPAGMLARLNKAASGLEPEYRLSAIDAYFSKPSSPTVKDIIENLWLASVGVFSAGAAVVLVPQVLAAPGLGSKLFAAGVLGSLLSTTIVSGLFVSHNWRVRNTAVTICHIPFEAPK